MYIATILLAQTKSGAIIEIIFLLLVAAIIGYVTAWYYGKSLFIEEINALKLEVNTLNKTIIGLEMQNSNLQKELDEKRKEENHLILEVKALKELHKEAVHETDLMKSKNKKSELLIYEKDEALRLIADRKHLLDYNSFGMASETDKDDLQMISGIGPFIEERLHALDIFTFKQISNFTAHDIETIDEAIEYFSGRIERDEWVAQAKELVYNEEQRLELLDRIRARKTRIYYDRIGLSSLEKADDLTVIIGIGGWIQEKLNALDIFTYSQISNFTDEDIVSVTEAIEYFHGRIERDEWIEQAKELVRIEGNKVELLKRISARKATIYYDRLGVAQAHEANNLTKIKGVSRWIEEKLNTLELYTFMQISKLTQVDVKTIAEILEIDADRINKEKWIEQASAFVKK
jgi:predicted flap endonuclease-1-like 5' DNA nuclease